jgi:hypothetical protein
MTKDPPEPNSARSLKPEAPDHADRANAPTHRDANVLAETFRYFGRVETPKMNSRIYTEYSLRIAEDAELLALAEQVMPSQPPPNVLFAAVQDLLLEDPTRSREARALARFYPAVSGSAIPDEPAFPALRAFCLTHAEELQPGLRHGRTQTSVVHRCTTLLPAIGTLPRVRAADGAVALLEVGPAAGLNLRLDHYAYRYEGSGALHQWGDPASTPRLSCAIRGDTPPALPSQLQVVDRRGLELSPLDLTNPRDMRWIRALVWPEHTERTRLMGEALEVAARVSVTIEEGDATRDIEQAVQRMVIASPRVVFATHAVYQMSDDGRRAMIAGLERASRAAPVDLVVVDSNLRGESRIDWVPFADGTRQNRVTLGHADSHGRWIEWGRAE